MSGDGWLGTWVANGGTITLTYPTDTVYTGTVSGKRITGTMANPGMTGCFTARKGRARAPQVATAGESSSDHGK